MKNRLYFNLKEQNTQREGHYRALVLLLAFLVVTVVSWLLHLTGVAMANETTCGLEEHQHNEDCYEEVLVCGLEESEEHVHSEDCYETRLVCGLEEHTHSVACLSDETADAETESDWEETLPELTGVWENDIVAVAESQLGYTESEENYILSEDGVTHKGYTRYGEWYGNEYGDWNSMFVSFCLYYAGIPEEAVPYASGAYAWTAALKGFDYYKTVEDDTSASGDLVFFDTDEDGRADRTGIVADVSEDELTIIEGDSNDQVEQNVYSISSAFAFVNLAAAYEEAENPEADSASAEIEDAGTDEADTASAEIEDAGTDAADSAGAEIQDAREDISGIAVTDVQGQEEAELDDFDEDESVSAAAETDDGISLASISGDITVAVGNSITLTSDVRNGENHSWSSDDTSIATVNGSGTSATVTGVSAGTVTITHTYYTRDREGHYRQVTETYTVTVTGSGSSSDTITVYVYVAGFVQGSNPKQYYSDDMLELLRVSGLDSYGYFAAGTIELDMSKLSGTKDSKITSEEEWDYVINVIKESLDTSTSQTCPDNLVAQYAEQIITDLSASQSNGYSGLWVSTGHSNIDNAGGSVNANGIPTTNGSYYWHLDIRFETVTITYEYGNNGITEGDSADGTVAGTKVFIKGATMDYTPAITAPDGYEVAGYYEDAAFTTAWDAVNQPITENTTVYIKLVSDTYELPSTGGMGQYPFTLVGLVLVGGAAGAICRRRKTKREEV